MNNITINNLPTASTIDGSLDILPIYTASSAATQGISRNTLLGLSSAPLGLTDSQSMTNKTIGNTNTASLKDTLFTLQDDGDTTKQLKFQLSGITTATTRTLTVPDISDTLVVLTATQTLTNKTLTSPTINSPTITNATISADTITGFSSSSTGTIYGLNISGGALSSPKIVSGLNDSNNNSMILFSPSASAVNQLSVLNATAGNPPQIQSTGSDSNIDLKLVSKGTGRVVINGAGASAYAQVATGETTTSTSYVQLTTKTDTVTVTVGNSGMVLLAISVGLKNSGAGNVAVATYAATGANTVAAADVNIASLVVGSNEVLSGSTKILTGLTAGSTTFTLWYRVDGGTGTFERRQITAVPL